MTDSANVYFEDITIGDEHWGTEEIADKDEMVGYASLFDPWPMHTDDESATASTPYGGLVASGGYTIGLWYRSGHGIWNVPDRRMAFLGGFDWHVKFLRPLRPGERVRLRAVFTDKRPSSKPGRGIVKAQTDLRNQQDETVLSIEVTALFATRPVSAPN